jgi:cytochrome P450
LAFLVRDPKYDECLKLTRLFVDNYVQQALGEKKTPERQYVFLNELVSSGASPEYIRAQVLAIIMGGRDTTASSLTALFWNLARRPDVVAKLREELSHLRAERPDWEMMRNMKYLNMVVKESRCFPYHCLHMSP